MLILDIAGNLENMVEDEHSTYCHERKSATVMGYRQYGHSNGSPQYARAAFGGGGTLKLCSPVSSPDTDVGA